MADFLSYKILKKKGFRYNFVIIINFSKYLWAIPLKNKNIQTITNELSNVLTESKRRPLKTEPDRGAEIFISIFPNFLRSENSQQYCRFRDEVSSIAERVTRTVRNLLKKSVFLKGSAD